MNPIRSDLPLQRTRKSKELAQEMVVAPSLPEEHRDILVRDIQAFPEPWLQKMAEHNLAVVSLSSHETLADTAIMPRPSEGKMQELLKQGNTVAQESVGVYQSRLAKELEEHKDDEFFCGMARIRAAEECATKVATDLAGQGLGFAVEVARESIPLDFIANQNRISETNKESFMADIEQANQGLGTVENGLFVPGEAGVMLVPYAEHKGEKAYPLALESYQKVTGMELAQNRGAHIVEEQLVLLHDSVVPDPANLKIGHYRVAIHEMGHFMDSLMRSSPKFGEKHEAFLDSQYEDSMQRHRDGDKEAFVSTRAMDNKEEFFAEAVESYLTVATDDQQLELYKPECNRETLLQRNPEMHRYLDDLFHFRDDAVKEFLGL